MVTLENIQIIVRKIN